MRITHRDITRVRSTKLEQQNYRCSLCGDHIIGDAVLDHDHKSGRIRSVLHRGCNALLGKLENNLARNLVTPQRLEQFAKNLVNYINEPREDIIHPTHRTPEERKALAKKRRIRAKKTTNK